MKNVISKSLRIAFAALFAFVFASCSDLFTSRNGSISISLPAARESVGGPSAADLYYDIEVCNSIGKKVYTAKKTPETQVTVSELEPGRYSVVVKAFTREEGPASGEYIYTLEYANYSREKYVNVKGATSYVAKLHEATDKITLTYSSSSGFETLGEVVSLDSFSIIEDEVPCSDWQDKYTLSYEGNAFGAVPFTVTSKDFDFITAECNVTVKYRLEGIVPVTLSGTGGNKTQGTPFSFSVTPVTPDSSYVWYQKFDTTNPPTITRQTPASLYQANTLAFQWYDGTAEINGATSSTLTETDAALGDHHYYCKIKLSPIDTDYCLDGESYTYCTSEIDVTVVDSSSEPSEETINSWDDLKNAVESYTDKETTKTIKLGGSYTASETITVKGNVKIIPTTNLVLDRGETQATSFTTGPLFYVDTGATLSLGGSSDYTLNLNGNSGGTLLPEGGDSYSATNVSSSAPLITSSGNLYLGKNCFLLNNHNTSTTTTGGAIYTKVTNQTDEISLTLDGCTISGCYSPSNGGGIYLEGKFISDSPATFTQIQFVMKNGANISENIAATNGGGLFLKYVNGNISGNSKIEKNFAGIETDTGKGQGGGIYLTGGTNQNSSVLTIEDGNSISENTGVQYGGGIYANTCCTLTVTEADIKDNKVLKSSDNPGKQIYIKECTTYNTDYRTSIRYVE